MGFIWEKMLHNLRIKTILSKIQLRELSAGKFPVVFISVFPQARKYPRKINLLVHFLIAHFESLKF